MNYIIKIYSNIVNDTDSSNILIFFFDTPALELIFIPENYNKSIKKGWELKEKC